MGYLWWGVAAFVHFQLVLVLILLLPYPTTRQWNWVFSTRIVQFFSRLLGFDVWNFYFVGFLAFLVLFIDSMREYRKYSAIGYNQFAAGAVQKEAHVKLLTSQRNYYISGAALMISIIVPRILSMKKENGLLSQQADTMHSMKRAFKRLLEVVVVGREDRGDYRGYRNPENEQDQAEATLLELIANELEEIEVERPRPRPKERTANRPLDREEVKELLACYDRIKYQKAEDDRANNNRIDCDPVQAAQTRQRQRPRSRFSTARSNPRQRNIHAEIARPPPPRNKYTLF